MKAVQYANYGSPDVLEVKETDKPTPKDDEVLIRVHAATVTAVDCTFRSGKSLMARLFTGVFRPKHTVPGGDLAGEIEAVGKDVSRLQKGDQVVASTSNGFGAHAEYVCLPEGALSAKPTNMSYEEAAAVPYGLLTALPFLRDAGHLRPGQKVLINGASGAVGSVAVQVAKHLGAEVTGVTSTSNLELVKSLGADEVIDYTRDDFTKSGRKYDLVFDTVGKSSFLRCKGSLTMGGIYLTPVLTPGVLLQMLWTSKLGDKKAVFAATGLRTSQEKKEDLDHFKPLLEAGTVRPVIDRRYPFERIADAHRYVEQGHKKGNVVVALS
jgi:NADPH:quinone reductase-like Zn-dependent oxidoreductase